VVEAVEVVEAAVEAVVVPDDFRKKGKIMPTKSIRSLFWALFGTFVLVLMNIILLNSPVRTLLKESQANETIAAAIGVSLAFFGLLFFALGLTLLILTIRARKGLNRPLKRFLLLTGSSAVGVPASILLHGLVYGLFILLFGQDFWSRTGIEDEPFFFSMGILVCPLAYMVGTIGSIILMFSKKKK
jgi:hypothetical protein